MSRLLPVVMTLTTLISPIDAMAWQDGAGYLELADRLDRPVDGYCLDVAGSGDWVDFSIPLNVHNCKGPHFFADEAVVFDRSPGPIRFPAYRGCVTAIGRDGRSLPQTALVLKPCAEDADVAETPFIAKALQTFSHRADGRIELGNSGLCLVAGNKSDVTFSPQHRWRALFLDRCDKVLPTHSVWKPFRSAN